MKYLEETWTHKIDVTLLKDDMGLLLVEMATNLLFKSMHKYLEENDLKDFDCAIELKDERMTLYFGKIKNP